MSKVNVKNIDMIKGGNVIAALVGNKLPIKVSYAIKKNLEIIKRELIPYEKERSSLIERYGEKDEDGKVKVENDNCVIKDIDNFNKDSVELLNIESEIDIHFIPLGEILNSNIEISSEELTSIEFMLK